jgi:hypothetical protein
MPPGYHLGPDIEGHGNDTVLSSKQAEALFKESVRGLPPDLRREQSRAITKLRLKGLAYRSYASDSNDLVVETQLAQMANKRGAEGLSQYQAEMSERLGGFTKGPKIEGHKNARCFVVPKESDDLIDLMMCTATKDDLLVSTTAYGADMNKGDVADLLKDQMDHIIAPGESI